MGSCPMNQNCLSVWRPPAPRTHSHSHRTHQRLMRLSAYFRLRFLSRVQKECIYAASKLLPPTARPQPTQGCVHAPKSLSTPRPVVLTTSLSLSAKAASSRSPKPHDSWPTVHWVPTVRHSHTHAGHATRASTHNFSRHETARAAYPATCIHARAVVHVERTSLDAVERALHDHFHVALCGLQYLSRLRGGCDRLSVDGDHSVAALGCGVRAVTHPGLWAGRG